MEIAFLINNVFLYLVIIIGINLALWVFFSNTKERINQLFLLFTFFNILWITFTYLSDVSALPEQINLAILFRNLAYGTVFLFLVSAYFFVKYFPVKSKENKFLDAIVLLLGIGLFLISLKTKLIVQNVAPRTWGNYPVFGAGALFAYTAIIFYTFLILYLLFEKYFHLPERDKLKVQYFIIGTFIFAGGNFFFNVVLAPFWKTYPYYYFGNYSAIFFTGFTAYAIVRRQLFGIKIVLATLMVSFISILLLLDIFIMTPDLVFRFIKTILLIAFIYFGHILIKSVLIEIEERKKIQRMARKLKAANFSLKTAYAKLQRTDQIKSEFVSITSHQLRTPLTVIKGYLSLILEGFYGNVPEKAKKPISNVYLSNERLIGLVDDFLNVSKLEANKTEMKFEKISLEELITSVINELKIAAESKNLKLIWNKPAMPLPPVSLDKEKIRQVLLNLIDNSIKYTEKGSVSISTEYKNSHQKNSGKILIKIQDTGEGITEEESDKIFESFSRGKAGAKHHTGGSGLGLYICRRFVKLHHGKIWVNSAGKGMGSTFYVELPIKQK